MAVVADPLHPGFAANLTNYDEMYLLFCVEKQWFDLRVLEPEQRAGQQEDKHVTSGFTLPKAVQS